MPLKKIDKVLRWRPEGKNVFNEDSFGPSFTLDLRWDDVSVLSVDSQGEEFMSMGAVYGDVEGEVLLGDRLLLLSEYAGKDPDGYVVRSLRHSRNTAGTRQLFKATLSR